MTNEENYENDLCYYVEETKTIVIKIDEIFNRPEIEWMNYFKINRRSYYKILHLIVSDYKFIIENYSDFLIYLIDIKHGSRSGVKEEILFEKIDEIIMDDDLFKVISDYIDDTYTLNLNSKMNVNDKNVEYAITDEKNKVILKTSILARLLVPIVCELDISRDELYFIFVKIMNKFSNNNKQAIRKLYKFIELRIHRTIYSDKFIWEFFSKRSLDPQIYIRTLNKEIINNIITKINHNKSVISFLDVVIRKKRRFAFTFNYPINIKSIKNSEKELEEKEKLEIYMLKHDKGELLLHTLSIEKEVKDVTIPENYKYLIDIHNPYTTKFLSIYYDDRFNPLLANKVQRAKLILKMYHELSNFDYKLIPQLLISDNIRNEKRLNNRKKLNEKIISSDRYLKFLYNNSDILSIIEKNNPILPLVSCKNYKFVTPTDEDLQLPLEELSNEIFDLIL